MRVKRVRVSLSKGEDVILLSKGICVAPFVLNSILSMARLLLDLIYINSSIVQSGVLAS